MNKPREEVDAAFIRDDEHTRKVGKLQEIICNLSEKNFSSSVDKIAGIGFTSDSLVGDLARNIIRLSCFHRSKLPLLVRLVSELRDKSELVSHIEHLVVFGIRVGAQPFLLSLVDSHIIDSSIQTRLVQEEKEKIQLIIEEDNINELKEIFSSPDFDINKDYKFKVSKFICIIEKIYLTLIEFSALCGSVACFRFLYINGAKMDREIKFGISWTRIINLAIAGGNVEIMTILEQAKILPDPSCIEYAIRFHRIEIFDWLLDQFHVSESESRYLNECIRNEFVHGIRRISHISPQNAFDASCAVGLSSLAKLLFSNFHLRMDRGLNNACKNGHIDVVKLLLSVPSIDVNKGYVSNIFILSFLH